MMNNATTMKASTVIDYIVQRLADEGITECFGASPQSLTGIIQN